MKTYEIAEPKGIDNLQLAERPTPEPGGGEVLVRLRATSLNYRDLVTVKGGAATTIAVAVCVSVSIGVGVVVADVAGVVEMIR